MIAAAFLIVALGIVVYFIRDDRQQLARFKASPDSAARRRQYRAWTVKAFLFFVPLSLFGLAALGRFDALARFPREFGGLAASLPQIGGDLVGFGGGLMIGGLIAGSVFGMMIARRKRAGRTTREPTAPPMLGDVAVILPRNRAEMLHGALLSLNAGVSEELFFRLLIPVLIVTLTGSAVLAFVAATMLFGLAHLYQGWVGVVATTVIGALFAFLYLATGSLLVPIVAHVLIDLNGLVLRPALGGAWRRARD